jgi:hypothetical protein
MRDQAELDAYKMVPVKMDEKGMAHFNGVGTENAGKDALYSISGDEVADIITYDDKKKEMHWLKEGYDENKNRAYDYEGDHPTDNEYIADFLLEVNSRISSLSEEDRYRGTGRDIYKDLMNTYDMSKEDIIDYLRNS